MAQAAMNKYANGVFVHEPIAAQLNRVCESLDWDTDTVQEAAVQCLGAAVVP